jgi:SAM-dependent methyltransferase
MILDVGCGDNKHGDLGLDIRRTISTDIIADALYLPFKDSAFTKIYSRHVIEHFGHGKTKTLLTEWLRVLQPECVIEIRCPDLRARALLLFFNFSQKNIENVYGEQNHEGNYHKCGFSYGALKRALSSCGVAHIKRVLDGYRGIPFVPCDLHVVGIKSKVTEK